MCFSHQIILAKCQMSVQSWNAKPAIVANSSFRKTLLSGQHASTETCFRIDSKVLLSIGRFDHEKLLIAINNWVGYNSCANGNSIR